MFTAIIIDDDELYCKLVAEMIKTHFPEIKLEGKANTFFAGIKKIHKYQPNLVFMDMELPDGKGYEIFNMTFPFSFKVIFITAHKDYAYEVINFSPAGYILKPIAACSFINAVLKALPQTNMPQTVTIENDRKSDITFNNKIVIKTTENIHIVHKEDIIRCEACRNYTTIYPKGEKGILVSQTLKDFETLFPYPEFIRVHQSHLINTNFIKRINKTDCCVHMADNSSVPIACRKREQLMNYVKLIDSH